MDANSFFRKLLLKLENLMFLVKILLLSTGDNLSNSMDDQKSMIVNKKGNILTDQYIEEVFTKLMTIVSQKPEDFVKDPDNIQELLVQQKKQINEEKYKANHYEYKNGEYMEKLDPNSIIEEHQKKEQMDNTTANNGQDLTCKDEVYIS